MVRGLLWWPKKIARRRDTHEKFQVLFSSSENQLKYLPIYNITVIFKKLDFSSSRRFLLA